MNICKTTRYGMEIWLVSIDDRTVYTSWSLRGAISCILRDNPGVTTNQLLPYIEGI